MRYVRCIPTACGAVLVCLEIKSDPVVLNKSLDKGMYFEYSGYDKVLSGVPYSLKFNIVKGKSK